MYRQYYYNMIQPVCQGISKHVGVKIKISSVWLLSLAKKSSWYVTGRRNVFRLLLFDLVPS